MCENVESLSVSLSRCALTLFGETQAGLFYFHVMHYTVRGMSFFKAKGGACVMGMCYGMMAIFWVE